MCSIDLYDTHGGNRCMRPPTCPEDPAFASPAGNRRRALCHLVMMRNLFSGAVCDFSCVKSLCDHASFDRDKIGQQVKLAVV